MKYVAFLDILGFKNKLKSLNHSQAIQYISKFSTVAYNEWRKSDTKNVTGYIVSDSFIIYTDNIKKESLSNILSVVKNICEREFSENGILIRGAIAKGNFDRIAATEISNLSKGLIVGQAYVDAYLLEDSLKSVGIVLSKEVFQDIEHFNLSFNCYNESSENIEKYILSYFDFDFLCKRENLSKLIDLGIESQWLPHYYNTLYFVIKNEKNNKRIYQLFDDLFSLIGDPSEDWREIDKFIKNAFSNDVLLNFQTRFLGYIREHIIANNAQKYFVDKRPSIREKILQYLLDNPNSNSSKISTALGISSSSVHRVINRLVEEKQIIANESFIDLPNGKRTMYTYSVAL